MAPKLPAAFSRYSASGPRLAEDRRSEQGAWIFLGSLGVFFFSCMLLFAIYVVLRVGPDNTVEPFVLPQSFILTTINMIAVSVLLHLATQAAKQQQLVDLGRYLILAFVLSLVFFVVQSFGLVSMIGRMLQPSTTMRSLYGFSFFLVIVHALHVVGGVAGLTFLMFGLARKSYDHERHFPVKFCAMYWHFLDFVWIGMLLSFGLAAAMSSR